MHELGVATDVLEAAVEVAAGRGPITAVHVELGADSHLDVAVLQEAFAMAAAGSVAEGAELDVEVVPAGSGLSLTALDVED